jgi:NhaD family Na+/H+ antiporter
MEHLTTLDLTGHWVGFVSIAIFVVAMILVVLEDQIHMRKSKPVTLAAGIIWALIAAVYVAHDIPDTAEEYVRHNLLEYAELFLFLLVAMAYINTMQERGVFNAIRVALVTRGLSYRQLFWMTGIISFFMSAIADNLTTALIMCAIVLVLGKDSSRFVAVACVNIVVSANAGGAFSPFGDITTLMVWQSGQVKFQTFFLLFIPSVVNYVVPAAFMHFAVPKGTPEKVTEKLEMLKGAKRSVFLFGLTILTAVCFHNFLHLPPAIGMMTGLAYLKLFGFYLRKREEAAMQAFNWAPADGEENDDKHRLGEVVPFDVFSKIARAEWDTLLFFYGVIMCVGGLGFIGYLSLVSTAMYTDLGPTYANVLVGMASSLVDNIPMMFAVLSMNPEMGTGQWLLVTLTAGVGGSLLAIGSAAGVALMGQARGQYTFFSHLKWTPVIALGYFASIYTHLWINSALFP